jgi:hypothetical protein
MNARIRFTGQFGGIEADPHQLLLVAEVDGQVVGTLQLTFIPSLTYTGGERAQIEGVRSPPATGDAALAVRWCCGQSIGHGRPE